MNIEKIGESKVKISLTLSIEEIKSRFDSLYTEIKKEVVINGFRKGHVPYSKYISIYGETELFDKAISETASEAISEALKEKTISCVLTRPVLDYVPNNGEKSDDINVELTFESNVGCQIEEEEYNFDPFEEQEGMKEKFLLSIASDKFNEYIYEEAGELVKINSKLTLSYKITNKEEEFKEKEENTEDSKNDNEQIITKYLFELVHLNPAFKSLLLLKPGDSVYFFEDQVLTKDQLEDLLPYEKFEIKDIHETKVGDIPLEEIQKVLPNVNSVEEYNNICLNAYELYLERLKALDYFEKLVEYIDEKYNVEVPKMFIKEKTEEEYLRIKKDVEKVYQIPIATYLLYLQKTEEQYKLEIENEIADSYVDEVVIEALAKTYGIDISEEKVKEYQEKYEIIQTLTKTNPLQRFESVALQMLERK